MAMKLGIGVSQWFWRGVGLEGCLRLLVGRHCDVYVMVDEESKAKQQLGFFKIKSIVDEGHSWWGRLTCLFCSE
jgi:hypothetical protein